MSFYVFQPYVFFLRESQIRNLKLDLVLSELKSLSRSAVPIHHNCLHSWHNALHALFFLVCHWSVLCAVFIKHASKMGISVHAPN